MALTFPDKQVGLVAPEVARVFRTLKHLPDNWKVWHRLTPWEAEAPDFLVLDDRGRALLMVVSTATPQQAQSTPQMRLLGLEIERQIPGQAEEHVLGNFLEQIRAAGVPAGAVHGAVVFPNLTEKELQIVQQAEGAPSHLWLDKAWVGEKDTATWAGIFPDVTLDASARHILRRQFAPEVVVPASFVARVPQTRKIAAGLGDYLLDYDQEHVLKSDLDLDTEGEQLSRDFRVQIVNGVTGSGKTLILLYRLRLLHALFPHKRFLVLTHNRPLIRDMQARFRNLQAEQTGRIDWYTFNAWCRKHWPESVQPWHDPISDRRRTSLVREVQEAYLADSKVSAGEFRSELEWVKDNGITTREGYLEASRRGRGFR
ncbi:MAG: DEAD/DEAH box helicase family protein, partial [Anaerolineae bacterium]|nr:DEAD/DEAH box helicase family protein [Anaerolineae bacterium]